MSDMKMTFHTAITLALFFVFIHHITAFTCSADNFRCDNGECIDSSLACDGSSNCRDSSDEANETCRLGPPACADEGFQCEDHTCIKMTARCNGIVDCLDKSDESLSLCGYPTTYAPCITNEWRCDNGQCIPSDLRCDTFPDCDDKSDETSNCRKGVYLYVRTEEQVHKMGEIAELICMVHGNISLDLSWRRGSGELPDKAHVVDGRLIIPAITKDDEDEYFCYTDTLQGIPEVKQFIYVLPDCSSPPEIDNGYCKHQHTLYGGQAIFFCNEGFIGSGSNIVYCDGDGLWTNLSFSCNKIDSPSIVAPVVSSVVVVLMVLAIVTVIAMKYRQRKGKLNPADHEQYNLQSV